MCLCAICVSHVISKDTRHAPFAFALLFALLLCGCADCQSRDVKGRYEKQTASERSSDGRHNTGATSFDYRSGFGAEIRCRSSAVALFFTMASARPTRTRTPVRGYGFDVLNSEDSASEDDFEADKSI